MKAEANDPRSMFYKRVLVRPKIPVLTLLLCTLSVLGAGVVAYVGIAHWLQSSWAAIICAIAAALVTGLLLAKYILIALVKTYQAVASEKTRNRCRYEPSCSAYMILSVEKYGFWRGFRKGLKRWRSCKPPNGGFDLP